MKGLLQSDHSCETLKKIKHTDNQLIQYAFLLNYFTSAIAKPQLPQLYFAISGKR